MEVYQFSCLGDNYAFLLHDSASGATAVVDTPEVEPIERALKEKGWKLTHILNTHHHADHSGGNLELKKRYGCTIVGPRNEAARIPGIDVPVGDGDVVELGAFKATVYDTPGHTAGHVVYSFPSEKKVFVGDTLFAMGCGRLFEGTPEQMWHSLGKLMALPEDTVVYCAHEYTTANGKFAISVEPGNADLVARIAEVADLRSKGIPTVPTTMALELATNPFLRPSSKNLQETIGKVGAPLVEVFAETRARKDRF